jgi:hypothetical protein
MLFLYPLLLQAWKDVPFQPWLRGSLSGITPHEMRNLLSLRDRFRRGTFTHVVMHDRLEQRYEDKKADAVGELQKAGFKHELIVANVKGLERLIRRLDWKGARTVWTDYGLETTYSADDAERKARFVTDAAASELPRLVWDIGCNEGVHSRIAAEYAEHVVAMDADGAVVDRLYRKPDEGDRKILLLNVDIDPPPASAGAAASGSTCPSGAVRPDALPGADPPRLDRGTCRSRSPRLAAREHGLARFEWVAPEDPMAHRLLARKRPGDHPDYRTDWFERSLEERFDVVRSEVLAEGKRTLYLARSKA